MRVFTTCRVCGDVLTVVDFHDVVHPCCDPRSTDVPAHHPVAGAPYVDQLTARFVDAVLAGDGAEADRLEDMIDRIDHAPPRSGEAALVYASWGWPVFPLRPGGKSPVTRHGFKDASTDPDLIRRWWTDHPQANIGVPTGLVFDVVDVDVPHGIRTWPALRDSEAMPDVHGVVTTASGGVHAYITPTGGGNMAGFRPGVDYRGRGGFVVVPPSIRDDGHRWVWTVKPSPVLVTAPGTENAA